ncbi:hypothetical protein [Pseudomonas chlororaphis]|uniref:hypothetical protein n=1 Tax=Pseudomonas chlororaphis TaxID=587753 RepID=UPI0039E303D6
MIAPWKFKCDNLHIQFDAEFYPEGMSPWISEALELLPREARVSRQMLLTISQMHSTCYTDNDFTTSHEAILKIAADLHSTQYYVPVLAIVDAPHSITRGAFLGYKKHIGKVEFGNDACGFDLANSNNLFQFNTLPSGREDITLLPHLTYRNYRTPDFEAKGLSVLDITDYTATQILKCTLLKTELPFLEKCKIRPITPYKVGLVSDSFTVNGAQYV